MVIFIQVLGALRVPRCRIRHRHKAVQRRAVLPMEHVHAKQMLAHKHVMATILAAPVEQVVLRPVPGATVGVLVLDVAPKR